MPSVVELWRSWSRPRAVVLALIAVGTAGCSAESTRFNDNPFRAEPTASIPSGQAAPVGRVDSQPLPQTSQLPPPGAAAYPASAPPAPAGVAGGGTGMASYHPALASETTGSVVTRRSPQSGNWSADGTVTVAPGDTVESIGRRHGVPASAIIQANHLAAPKAIQPGQQLVIPRSSRLPAAIVPPKSAPASTVAAAGNSGVHVVASGDTLSKISRRYGKALADVAKANNIQPHAKLNIGDRIVIPGVKATQSKSAAVAQPQSPALASPKAPAAEPAESAAMVAPAADTQAPLGSVKASADATATFRWPVRGRVIAGFGPKPNGQQNDGINVAVPENTPIKAAEDGVVAYAGNELKGYGNLVLVRHSNGYVTAYAHASELLVKRGDQIKRGQIIAKSGQTGNVDAPQVHFEIRKGPAPVDPMPFLNGA
jgi:murein DD-endopeptidase MepM/ murein hydrolase activator NlpD